MPLDSHLTSRLNEGAELHQLLRKEDVKVFVLMVLMPIHQAHWTQDFVALHTKVFQVLIVCTTKWQSLSINYWNRCPPLLKFVPHSLFVFVRYYFCQSFQVVVGV